MAIAYFGFQGINVVFPLWLQSTLHYTATWAGLAVAPVGLLALVAAPTDRRSRRGVQRPANHTGSSFEARDEGGFTLSLKKTGVIVNLAPVLCVTGRYARLDEYPSAHSAPSAGEAIECLVRTPLPTGSC
jgi:hypothetical protein